MAGQEFLASFGVEIDESGLEKLQKAPVSINVTAAGSNPEAVGRSIDDVAERYLLRTLEGAL